MHYCMGGLADWGFGTEKSKICSNCGMQESDGIDNGCCKDTHIFIKNNTDQKNAEKGLCIIPHVTALLPVIYMDFYISDFTSVTAKNPLNQTLPRSRGVAVYIRNCIFLI